VVEEGHFVSSGEKYQKASQQLAQNSSDELSVLYRKNGFSGWPL
jgi:hypothetical protein